MNALTIERQQASADLIEALSNAALHIDADGHIDAWNSLAERALGWKAEAVIGEEPPLLSPSSWRLFVSLLREDPRGTWTEHSLRIRHLDGSDRLASLRVSIRAEEDGRESWHIEFPDITPVDPNAGTIDALEHAMETAQAQWSAQQVEQLASRAEEFQRILHHSPGILLILDLDDEFTPQYLSENIDRLGYSAASLLAGETPMRSLVHPDDLPRTQMEVEYWCAIPSCTNFRLEFRWIAANRAVHWMDTHLWIHRDGEGVARQVQGIAWDITERKRGESQHKLAVSVVELLNCTQDVSEVVRHALDLLVDYASLSGASVDLDRGNNAFEHFEVGFEASAPLPPDSCALARLTLEAPPLGHRNCEDDATTGCEDREGVQASAEGSRWSNTAARFLSHCCEQKGAQFESGSFAIVPLRASGEMIGILQLYSDRDDTFENSDIEFFESLGYSLGIALDRERTVRQLRSSEERYRGLFETSRDGIAIRDLDGCLQAANRSFLQLVGMNLEEIRRVPAWHYRRRPENVPAGQCFPGDLLANGFTEDQELEILRPDGSVLLVNSRSWLMIDESGHPFRELEILRDVTEERAAAQERLRLATAIEQSAEVVVITDTEGTIEYVNPSFERVTGYSRQEALGSNPRVLNSGTQDAAFYSDMWATIERGEDWQGRFVNRRKDGALYHEDATISGIRDEHGRITHYIAVKRDVTKLVELESELLQAQKLESIGRLAAGIAHEINTPSQYVGDNVRFLQEAFEDLTGVLAAAQQLASEAEGVEPLADALNALSEARDEADVDYLLEEMPTAIGQSLEGLGRISTIVGAMKHFSHPGADEMTPVDLSKSIESTVTVARNEWKYVAEMQLEISADLPMVRCLPNEINQVVLNLVINAAHAIEARERANNEKGTITVRARVDGTDALIQIADTGTGIPPEAREKIFDPFFTTKDVGKGTGQGLSIARDVIAGKHGGSLEFETEMGVGTTFSIRLPLADSLERADMDAGDSWDDEDEVIR